MSKKIEINTDSAKKETTKPDKKQSQSEPKPKEKKAVPVEYKALKSKIGKKEAEIKDLKVQLTEVKADYLRQLADKENLRKRLEREKSEFYQNALSDLISEFLVVLDNFERALQTDLPDTEKSFREGVEMIYKLFLSVLSKQGVNPIDIRNAKFDPRLHQAFATAESGDVDEPVIDEEYQKGYTLNDRLLRPSLVKVLIPKKEKK